MFDFLSVSGFREVVDARLCTSGACQLSARVPVCGTRRRARALPPYCVGCIGRPCASSGPCPVRPRRRFRGPSRRAHCGLRAGAVTPTRVRFNASDARARRRLRDRQRDRQRVVSLGCGAPRWMCVAESDFALRSTVAPLLLCCPADSDLATYPDLRTM